MLSSRTGKSEASVPKCAGLLLLLYSVVCTAMIPTAVAAPTKKELEIQALAKEKAARAAKMPAQQYL
ncbi:MAG TPA: hypothetical protein PLI59_01005, partial [Candidatus Obscuribacter sp.]|nr:hypothetical protein [Candidatus Obscuribacter sp.]